MVNKWTWTLLAIVALAALIVWQRGKTKTAYVNGLPEYSSLPGKEYIFERDCYVFKSKKKDTAYPLVGANAAGLAGSVADLPTEVKPEYIGKEVGAVRILDLVRTGSRFKIISVRREQSRTETTISLEILMTDEADRRYPRMDAFYILDHSPEKTGAAPRIIESYAVERVKK